MSNPTPTPIPAKIVQKAARALWQSSKFRVTTEEMVHALTAAGLPGLMEDTRKLREKLSAECRLVGALSAKLSEAAKVMRERADEYESLARRALENDHE